MCIIYGIYFMWLTKPRPLMKNFMQPITDHSFHALFMMPVAMYKGDRDKKIHAIPMYNTDQAKPYNIYDIYMPWHTRTGLELGQDGPGSGPVMACLLCTFSHDVAIKWKHFPHYWPFVRGIHCSPVNSPHKGQWRGALMFSLIFTWTNGWVNNWDKGDLGWHHAHYDVTVMRLQSITAIKIYDCLL